MSSRLRSLSAFLLFATIFAYHALKGLGVPMWVIPDEAKYSYSSRLLPLAAVEIPNYLYYLLYGTVDRFGAYFLDTVRVYNAVLLMAGGVFIYLIARLLCSRGLSLFVAAASLLLPTTLNAIFFMPDIPYQTAFWGFAWFALRCRRLPAGRFGLAAGALIALASFVKVHALFLLPGLVLYAFFRPPPGEGGRGRILARFLLALIAAFAVVKFGGGYLMAGENGLTLLGHDYNSYSNRAATGLELDTYLIFTVYAVVGHLMSLSILFGPPLVLLTGRAVETAGDEREDLFRRAATLFLCQLLPLIGLSSLFSSMTSFVHPFVVPPPHTELQARFFNFLYPGLIIAAAYGRVLSQPGPQKRPRSALIAWIAVIVLALLGIVGNFEIYNIRIAPHYPELATLLIYGPRTLWYAAAGLALLSTALLSVNVRRACGCYLFVFLPVYCLGSTIIGQLAINHWRGVEDIQKRSARTVADFIGEEKSRLALYFEPGFNDNNVGWEIMFYLDSTDVQMITHPTPDPSKPAPLDPDRILPDRKWLWVKGRFTYPENFFRFGMRLGALTPNPDYRFELLRLADFDRSVDLAGNDNPWPIRGISGNESEMVIDYAIPLPEAAEVRLEFDGIDKNDDSSFLIAIPESGSSLRLDAQGGWKGLLQTNGNSRTVIVCRLTGTTRPQRLLVVPAEPGDNQQ